MTLEAQITDALNKRDAVADWKRCRHWIEDALKYSGGAYAIEDVEQAIEAGRMQFWPGHNCAAITECVSFPRKKMLNITLAGGDMQELIGMIPSFSSFASFLGCSELAVAGRPGWEKVLRGWKKGFVVLSTPVEGAMRGVQSIQ